VLSIALSVYISVIVESNIPGTISASDLPCDRSESVPVCDAVLHMYAVQPTSAPGTHLDDTIDVLVYSCLSDCARRNKTQIREQPN
jgi:hypothetical protein